MIWLLRLNSFLIRSGPDIILAEAVGSCTDLSATVYQAATQILRNQFDLAPLTILVEPDRIRALVDDDSNGFPDTVRYLFEKQLAEADLNSSQQD